MATKRHMLQRLQFAQLRTRIADQIRHFHPQLRKTLLGNLSELIAAVVMARSVQLARIGEELPVNATEAAREQWVRRQLSNNTEDTLHLFRPVAESLLAGFAGRTVRLILDPTDLADDLTIVTIGLAYQGRALPLAWATVYIKPDTVKEAIHLLFAELTQWLPQDAHVYLLGDREFHGEEMLQLIQAQGWIPVVRTMGDIKIELEDGRQCEVQDLAPARGQTAFYQQVWLTLWGWGPYSLSLSNALQAKRGLKPEDPWYIVSTEPAGPQMLALYRCRMWLDETFRDLKSHGFHLEQTRLDRTDRLDRLMLVLALACWWVLGRGIWVERTGQRRQVDRVKQPKCSLFTLGLRWINQLLNRDELPEVVLVPEL
jgi:hypothetical protein